MNQKQLIIATVASTLMVFANSVAAECGDGEEAHLVKTGYLMLAGNDRHEDQGNQQRRGNDNRQGDNDQGNHKKDNKEKNRSTDGRAWYNPWGWEFSGRDNNSGRDNQNSNRQSDPDSTRGQARAEERRQAKDKDRLKDDRPWYNPWGWFE